MAGAAGGADRAGVVKCAAMAPQGLVTQWAYGWTDWGAATPDDQILHRLLVLNRERSGGGYGR